MKKLLKNLKRGNQSKHNRRIAAVVGGGYISVCRELALSFQASWKKKVVYACMNV